MRRDTVPYLSSFTRTERDRLGTLCRHPGAELSPETVLVIRWFLDNTRVRQLTADNSLSGRDLLPLPLRRCRRAHGTGTLGPVTWYSRTPVRDT